MRTTVRLSDGLLRQAKREAARRGQTLTALLEEGLRLALARRDEPAPRRPIPVATQGGEPLPGVSFECISALLDDLDRRSD